MRVPQRHVAGMTNHSRRIEERAQCVLEELESPPFAGFSVAAVVLLSQTLC